MPNNWELGFWVIVIIIQGLGGYMIIRYLEPEGLRVRAWAYEVGSWGVYVVFPSSLQRL